jgi:putative FmdB family regulatory protein
MPTYEYQCQKCKELFSVVLSMSEHDQAKIVCPACHGRKVNQQYSVFYAKTSKKS